MLPPKGAGHRATRSEDPKEMYAAVVNDFTSSD